MRKESTVTMKVGVSASLSTILFISMFYSDTFTFKSSVRGKSGRFRPRVIFISVNANFTPRILVS